MKKPATMVYGVDEVPPIALTIVTAVQHVGVIAMFLIYPLVVSNQVKLGADEVLNILQMGMLVLAAAVLLQGLPKGPVGSRFLAPSIFTGVYLAPSMMAVKLGGMPLVWGMTIFAGVIEAALSTFWSRLRVFIPPGSGRTGRKSRRHNHRARGVTPDFGAQPGRHFEARRRDYRGGMSQRHDWPQHLEQRAVAIAVHSGGN